MAEYRLTVPITVRDLTQRADLGLVLSAGEAGAARAIKWAHAIELNDPTPYLTHTTTVYLRGEEAM
ncbi:Hypothetical peptidase [Mycobacteroides abscessus]|nr:Hypothetical peptidase [Mycobacteroides abscessus]